MSIVCPICSENDAIQKLSAIRSSAQSTAWVRGYGGTITTEIAELLRPPNPPVESPFDPVLWIRKFTYWILVILMPVLVIVMLANINSGSGGEFFIAFTLVCVLAYWVWSLRNNIKELESSERLAKMEENRMARKEAWKATMEIWERSYYCLRDDVIFDPVTNNHDSPKNLADFLKKSIAHETSNGTNNQG